TGDVVVNNTVITAADGSAPLRLGSQASGNTVFNNIFLTLRDGWPWVDADTDAVTGLKIDHNAIGLYEFIDGSNASAAWTSTNGFGARLGVGTGPAPLFVDLAGNGFRLKAGSPAVGQGLGAFNGMSAPPKDILGNGRPSGTGYDIGAYEYQG